MKLAAPLALAALLLSVGTDVAAAVDNPECLGSDCGRPAEERAEPGFFASLWDDLLALFA